MKLILNVFAGLLAIFSFQASACIDPPTNFKLTKSSFERVKMQVSSWGLSFDETGRVSYRKGQWCAQNPRDKSSQCGRPSFQLRDSSNHIVGVVFFEGKVATLKQVKKPTSPDNFQVDDAATKVVFEDKSDPEGDDAGSDVFVTQAVKKSGEHLGSIRSEHMRLAKGLPPTASDKVIDLASADSVVAGCGGAKEEQEEFQVGGKANH